MTLNIDKMRHQLERTTLCGARLLPGPGVDAEVCTVSGPHERHNWPSLSDDPDEAWRQRTSSGLRLMGITLGDLGRSARPGVGAP